MSEQVNKLFHCPLAPSSSFSPTQYRCKIQMDLPHLTMKRNILSFLTVVTKLTDCSRSLVVMWTKQYYYLGSDAR